METAVRTGRARRFVLLSLAAAFTWAVAACVGDDPAGTSTNPPDSDASTGDDASAGDASTDADAAAGAVVDDVYQAGTRLQPNWITSGDQRRFVDWWDSKLGLHCVFRELEAGKLRCVPVAPVAFTAPNYWANDTCTTPAGKISSCATKPPYVSVGGACVPEIHRTGSPISTAYYKADGTGVCTNQGAETAVAFQVGEEIPPSEWQEGTLEEAPGASTALPVKAQFVRGADGSYGFFRWTPKSVTTTCTFGVTPTDPTLRCRPTFTTTGGFHFTDSACTERLFPPVPASCSPAPKPLVGVVQERTPDPCGPKVVAEDYYLLAGEFSGPYFQPDESGKCVSSGSTVAGVIRAGAKLDPAAAFGVAVAQREPSTTRLSAEMAVLPDGTRSRLGFYDTKLGIACELSGHVRAADGRSRCLPAAPMQVTTAFSDAQCKTAVTVVDLAAPIIRQCRNNPADPSCPPPGTCTVPPKPAFAYSQAYASICGDSTRTLYALGAKRTATYFKNPNGVCVDLGRPDVAIFDVTEIPPTEFAEATLSYP